MDTTPDAHRTSPRGFRCWISYAACAWTVCFAAPHVWWALGNSVGFPGGEESFHTFMSSTWLYVYNVAVIALCAAALVLTIQLLRPTARVPRRRAMHLAVWIASGALLSRGVAGLMVDGTSDPIWWPTFLTGGILFGGVAWFAKIPGSEVSERRSR